MDNNYNDLLNECFDGNPASLEDALDYSASKKIRWHELVSDVTTLPDYEHVAIFTIKERLGYLPPYYAVVQFLPYLKSVLHQFHGGKFSSIGMVDEVDDCIRFIRNEDMKRHTTFLYDDHMYKHYDSFLSLYRVQARDRLVQVLDYAPEVDISAEAEIVLRTAFADEQLHLSDSLTEHDMRAIAMVKYREILVDQGYDAAAASPLVATDIRAWHEAKKAIVLDGS